MNQRITSFAKIAAKIRLLLLKKFDYCAFEKSFFVCLTLAKERKKERKSEKETNKITSSDQSLNSKQQLPSNFKSTVDDDNNNDVDDDNNNDVDDDDVDVDVDVAVAFDVDDGGKPSQLAETIGSD